MYPNRLILFRLFHPLIIVITYSRTVLYSNCTLAGFDDTLFNSRCISHCNGFASAYFYLLMIPLRQHIIYDSASPPKIKCHHLSVFCSIIDIIIQTSYDNCIVTCNLLPDSFLHDSSKCHLSCLSVTKSYT